MLELMLTMSTWYFGWLLSMFYPPVSYWVNYNKKLGYNNLMTLNFKL